MKILLSIISLTRGKGGAERVAAELANEMHSRGHEITVYSSSAEGEEPSYELARDIRHIQIPLYNAEEVRRAILDVNPDVFFIFYATAHLLDQYALIAPTGIPVGAQECTNPVRVIENFTLRKEVPDIETAFAMRKAVLCGMQGIRFTMDSYINYLPEIAKPFCRTYNNTFRPAERRADIGKREGRKSIINVGGLKVRNKNGVVLARAFASLAEEFPDWDLYFYGKNNLSEVNDVIAKSGLKDRIILGGSKSDIYAEYAKSQIHVITSFEEGCPNVVCEAMLHGIPSIGFSDCRGTNELVVDGRNGLLVDRASEVENLAAALRLLMSDEALRRRLGEAAYKEARDRFDGKKIYDRWEALFSHIASYKGNTERLYAEQCAIDPATAEEMRRLRTLLLKNYSKKHFLTRELATNEKIVLQPLPKVSIIIPVFNKGEYIAETLDSVLSCDYPDKEILIVDDASTDQSSDIIRSYERLHKNVKVIRHEANMGLSVARNSGLSQATGVYISFWDADDIYAPKGLAKIVQDIEIDRSDIATGIATRGGQVMAHYKSVNMPKRRVSFSKDQTAFSTSSSCFKIYRHSFLKKHGLTFVPGLYMQDMEFNIRAFSLSRFVTVTSHVMGEYRYVQDSWGKTFSAERMESSFKVGELSKKFIEEHGLFHYESLRQGHMLKLVFVFFINKLLQLKHKGKLGVCGGYLERYRKTLLQYPCGVTELALTHPLWALGIVAFVSGQVDLAFSLLVEERIKGYQNLYSNNAFGLTEQQVEALRYPPPRTGSRIKNGLSAKRMSRVIRSYYERLPLPAQRILQNSRTLQALKEKYLR